MTRARSVRRNAGPTGAVLAVLLVSLAHAGFGQAAQAPMPGDQAIGAWLAQPLGDSVRVQGAPMPGTSVQLPKTHLAARDVALVINRNDPLSIKVGRYYRERRSIPEANVVKVALPSGRAVITPQTFARIKRDIDRALPDGIQAYALAWRRPYRVECMSITSAFAFGFDSAFCSSQTCGRTRESPYYNSVGHAPHSRYGIRPAMMLAATSFAEAKALIDRGVRSDGSRPEGTAYLVSTSDAARNVRAEIYPKVAEQLGDHIAVETIEADAIRGREDVMFYFTGLARVPDIETNRYLPGAVADHLTSAGGRLTVGDESSQMSALRWLQAGATASYGTVVEPCNLPWKFPNPAPAIGYYLQGHTVIEAYWKSVAWPGEGVFIGEPLARPYDVPASATLARGSLTITSRNLAMGRYTLLSAPSPVGPYSVESSATVDSPLGTRSLRLELAHRPRPVYRLVRSGPERPTGR